MTPIIDGLFAHSGYQIVRKTRFGRDDVTTIFESINSSFPVRWEKARKIYIDNQLRRPVKATQKRSGHVIYYAEIQPTNRFIVAFQIGLPIDFRKSFGLTLRVRADDTDLEYDVYKCQRIIRGITHSTLVVFLRKPIEDSTVTTEISYDHDIFTSLRKDGCDWFRTRNISSVAIRDFAFICLLPPNPTANGFDLQDLPKNSPFYTGIPEHESALKQWAKGDEVNPQSERSLLNQFCSHEMGQNPQVLGWSVDNIDRSSYAGFYVTTECSEH